MFSFIDDDPKNKYGIDKLDFLMSMIKIQQSESTEEIKIHMDAMEQLCTDAIGRSLNTTEKIKMLEALKEWNSSDGGSKERAESIQYLVECDFIEQ